MKVGYVYAPYVIRQHTEESLKEYDEFMSIYNKLHEYCPKCGGKDHISTLMGYALNLENKEEYKDENSCVCSNCGNIHITHDRVPFKIDKNDKR